MARVTAASGPHPSGLVRLEPQACPICGEGHSVHYLVTKAQFERLEAGEHIQAVLPHWTAGDRETLISGSHEECFDRFFGGAE